MFYVFCTYNYKKKSQVSEPREEVTTEVQPQPETSTQANTDNTKDPKIEAYNDANWQKYNSAWLKTCSTTSSIISCKNNLDAVHASLEEAHKEYLRAEINDEDSNTLNFKEGIYQYTEKISRLLNRIVTTYDMNKNDPDFIPEMYILEDMENSNEDTATARLNQIISELEEIRNFSNDFKCLEVTEIEKNNREKICEQLIDLNYAAKAIKNPIYREQFEIDEEYELALKDREDDKEYALYECVNYNHSYN